MNFARALIVLTALFGALPGQAANPAWDAPTAAPANAFPGEAIRDTGKSFLDHVRTSYAEEPSYSVPAIFPGPLAVPPRDERDTRWMLLACFGLLVYLGRRRGKTLAASF